MTGLKFTSLEAGTVYTGCSIVNGVRTTPRNYYIEEETGILYSKGTNEDEWKICNNTYNMLASLVYDATVDWSTVKEDAPILCRDEGCDKYVKRHFAKYEDGDVYVYAYGCSSFTAPEEGYSIKRYEMFDINKLCVPIKKYKGD